MLLVEQDEGAGIFMCGHLTNEQREAFKKAPSDAYKCGWNDAHIEGRAAVYKIMETAESGLPADVRLLLASGSAFWRVGNLSLNMNDVWGWALSWIPDVPADQVAEVARLFRLYGNAGLMYWHTTQPDGPTHSEFQDNQRAVDFVRHEEEIRKQFPNSSKRAYHKTTYVLGLPREEISK